MKESILKFAEQFSFQPEIVNADKLGENYEHYILAGMGGSHLAAGLTHIMRPGINLYIHRDYGLPPYEDAFMSKSLFIASSYSGNTEEVVDFLESSYSKGYDVVVITTGGKLLKFAQENELPHIVIPDTGIQPRSALGFMSLALAAFVEPEMIPELQNMSQVLDPESLFEQAKDIADSLKGSIPVIYTSTQNRALGYIWKIKMNETAKVPGFSNVFPELNHNEMQGYDFVDSNKELSEKIHFIFIHDSEDNPKIELRMKTAEALFEEKGLPVTSLFLEGDSIMEKLFKSILLGDWVSLMLADTYGTEPEEVPLIEEFKKRIA